VVRIPVEQAMKLLAERGLPARDVNSQPSPVGYPQTTGANTRSETKPGRSQMERQ
jgi:hypothetical protein